MPQLPNNFSAYPVTVTLDGTGSGIIRFQATGQRLQITNLFVSVASQTLQAKCTMYKGQVGPQYAVKTTNSGSTGAAASGAINLMDGEAVYVVWTGGDPGATATATFTGRALPFDASPAADESFLWDDPIAAGDGSLIYPGLQSVNYVAGISGWRISRDGDAEFNNVTARGDIIVSDANGAEVRILINGNGTIEFVPPDNASYVMVEPGKLFAQIQPAFSYTAMSLGTPTGSFNGNFVTPAQIFLQSSRADGIPHAGFTNNFGVMELGVTNAKFGLDVVIDGTLKVDGTDIGQGFVTEDSYLTNTAAFGTETVMFSLPSTTYEANRLYRIDFDGRVNQSLAGTGPLVRVRNGTTIVDPILVTVGRIATNGNVECAPPAPVYFRTSTAMTRQLCVTMGPSAGTCQWQGPRGVSIWDVGLGSYRPNVPLLT